MKNPLKNRKPKEPKKPKVEKIKAEDANIIEEIKTTTTPKDMSNKQENKNTEDKEININLEPEQTTQQTNVVDPLIEAEPIVPEYAKVQVEGEHNYEPIPEEEIERPTINFNENTSSQPNAQIGDNKKNEDDKPKATETPQPKAVKAEPMNQDLSDKSTKEKKDSAKYFAQTLVDGYEALHIACVSWMEKSDEKLMKMAVKGKIEIDVINSELDLGQNTVIRIRTLIDEYNTTIKEVLVVSPEFKNEILPLLEAELFRRNVGMTTMQRIIAVVVKDLQPKITKVIQMNTTLSSVLQHQTEIIRRLKEGEQGGVQQHGNTIIIDGNQMSEPSERSNE